MPTTDELQQDINRIDGLIIGILNQFDSVWTYIADFQQRITQCESDIRDLQTRTPIVEDRTPKIEESYRRFLELVGSRSLDVISMSYVLAPLSEPGELPDTSKAKAGLVGLEVSESLRSVRPPGADSAVTLGGGSAFSASSTNVVPVDANLGTEPDLDTTIWLGKSVAHWAQTATLKASIDAGAIELDYSVPWLAQQIGRDLVKGTFWIFVARGSTWYAAPILDFLSGQTAIPRAAVNGLDVNIPPIDASWVPAKGIRYWIMISGIANGVVQNSQERSNLVSITW